MEYAWSRVAHSRKFHFLSDVIPPPVSLLVLLEQHRRGSEELLRGVRAPYNCYASEGLKFLGRDFLGFMILRQICLTPVTNCSISGSLL